MVVVMIVFQMAKRSKLTLVLDENVYQLEAAFKDCGYKTIVFPKGTDDEKIKELSEGWILVTKNSKDFIKDAVRYDYDIIALEHLKFIDDQPSRKNKTIELIADAIYESGLSWRKGNFLLTIGEKESKLLELV